MAAFVHDFCRGTAPFLTRHCLGHMLHLCTLETSLELNTPITGTADAQLLPALPHLQMTARFLPIVMSAARVMPSVSKWRHQWTLSNMDFVTQAFTLTAGTTP